MLQQVSCGHGVCVAWEPLRLAIFEIAVHVTCGTRGSGGGGVCLLVGCLTFQQQASVSQGRICSDNLTCCHIEIEVADQTFYLTQSQYTDTGPTSPSADPITPVAWRGSHWRANFEVTGMTRPRKNPGSSRIRTRDLPLSRRTPWGEGVAVGMVVIRVVVVFGWLVA